MGVKTHFLLNTGAVYYVDKTAFNWLKANYDVEVAKLRIPKVEIKPQGWRKNFTVYYKSLRKAGFGISMSVMKCRYPHRDASYNSILQRPKKKAPPRPIARAVVPVPPSPPRLFTRIPRTSRPVARAR